MATYSVAAAKNSLSRLIDEALGGDEVMITRHGKPTVRLTVIEPPTTNKRGARWLYERGVPYTPGAPDSVELLRRVYEEEP